MDIVSRIHRLSNYLVKLYIEVIIMETFSFKPSRMVCAQNISFDLEDGKLYNVKFRGGCNGNLQAISKLVEGQPAEKVAELLHGNDCNGRGTSCADQFSDAIMEALKQKEGNSKSA